MIAVNRVSRIFSDDGDVDDEYANTSHNDDSSQNVNPLPKSQQLVNVSSSALTVFTSPAAEYFSNRSYKGLLSSPDANAEMRIVHGQYGIAASYEPYSIV